MTDKLPIPRLRRQGKEIIHGRTSRACEACRERKSKCDGVIPTCSQCVAQGLENCSYPERKVIRQEKEIASMRSEIKCYQKLLQDISDEQNGSNSFKVKRAIRKFGKKERTNREITPSSSSQSLGSLEQNETAHEDFNRNETSRATGFVGNNSELAWMQHLNLQSSNQQVESSSLNISSMDYHLDHKEIPDMSVTDIFALPRKKLADSLFELYLENFQNWLPIIRKDLFVAQYNHCYLRKGEITCRKWLAILNMIFAIACTYQRLSGREPPPEANERVFSTRAKSLSISENVLYDHSDLQQVQAETLMALLLLTQSQINRSWKMIGVATRSGISLGLNLEKKIAGLDVKSGEARKQLWWSIHRLESLLSVMTGRSSCLGNTSYSAMPPFLNPRLDLTIPDISQPTNELRWTINLSNAQRGSQTSFLRSLKPSQSLYRFYMADLALLSQGIINEVYVTGASQIGRNRIDSRIVSYREKVDFWASTIHPSFCFKGHRIPVHESPFRSSLALNYYSICILLSRPSLAGPSIEKKGMSQRPRTNFANQTALFCLHASLGAVAQLPEQPDLSWWYQVPQWWNLLHILTQATVVLLLDLSIGPTLADSDAFSHPDESDVWASVMKALRWLHCLATTSESARRAFRFFRTCAHRMAPSLVLDFDNLSPVADLSTVSHDPEDSRSGDRPESGIFPTPQDHEAINDMGNLTSDVLSIDQEISSYKKEEGVQRASQSDVSAVLDLDRDICDLTSSTGLSVEDLLFSVVE